VKRWDILLEFLVSIRHTRMRCCQCTVNSVFVTCGIDVVEGNFDADVGKSVGIDFSIWMQFLVPFLERVFASVKAS
jgi:hypothetical protein